MFKMLSLKSFIRIKKQFAEGWLMVKVKTLPKT